MIRVSVIVPVYNTEKYLARCLDALVGQTLSSLEIIAVDDGSTDDSPRILETYADRFPNRIRVIHKENGGQASARNIGIREAAGEYVGFADSDDCVEIELFEKLLQAAEKSAADYAECKFHFVREYKDGSIQELTPRGRIREHNDNRDMFIDPQVSPWNKIYRRSILTDNEIFFPEGIIYEDTSFYIKAIPYLKNTAAIDDRLVYYYLREESTMNRNKSLKVGDIFKVFSDILDFYRDRKLFDKYHDELEYFCVKTALCSSMSRIGRVSDKQLENRFLDTTFSFIREQFPEYKRNKYFTGKIGMYIKLVNRGNAKIIDKILARKMKG